MNRWVAYLIAGVAAAVPAVPATADITLSQLVVELQPGKHDRQDVDVANGGSEPAYVEVAPREIVAPGTTAETPRQDPDPEKLGLLVSPARMILAPGQHRLIRIATLLADTDRERVYRVTVKPVVGKVSSTQSGLKLLLGYDMLVLVRPAVASVAVTAARSGKALTFRNDGNVSVELIDGQQCDSAGHCSALANKRLYSGASWTEQLNGTGAVTYTVNSPGKSERRRF
jgi:P pilus assembly chaperone PapD